MPRPRALKIKNLHIKNSLGPKTSGHDVDFGTFTHNGSSFTPWITKLNKHKGIKGEEASVLEVAFSEIALLFIKPGLTPPARIVTDEQEKVVGVASENFNVQIKNLMEKRETCYSIDPHNWTYNEIPRVDTNDQTKMNSQRDKFKDRTQDKISNEALAESLQLDQNKNAVHFLDKMPKNFFAELMEKHNNKEVIVDMESLASILTASYFLEEDDLHKGNIGFYITEVTNPEGTSKKKFNFFKIDHDLMFIDSIMSQKDMRIANIIYDKKSFKISTQDLDNFPDLKDSGNHYWPTKGRIIVAGDKAYSSKEERQAFANLKDDPQFIQAKWKYFLKSAIMPRELIEKSLNNDLDRMHEIDKINLVRNAISTRSEKFLNKLLDSAQFREYIKLNGAKAFDEIKKEIEIYIDSVGIKDEPKQQLMNQLQNNFELIAQCSAKYNSQSPIYRSLVLGTYDFSKKTKTTEEHINRAFRPFEYIKEEVENTELFISKCNAIIKQPVDAKTFTAACIAIDVIKKSGNPYKEKELKILQQVKDLYINPRSVKTFEQFIDLADKIRTTNLPLVQQKKEIIAAFKSIKLPHSELEKLKKELQKNEPDSPSLKFIKQLRSENWFVRKILGTYGITKASTSLLHETKAKLENECITTTQNYKKVMGDVHPKITNKMNDIDTDIPLSPINRNK